MFGIVTLKKAVDLSGYTADQFRARMRSGDYEQGVIWWKEQRAVL